MNALFPFPDTPPPGDEYFQDDLDPAVDAFPVHMMQERLPKERQADQQPAKALQAPPVDSPTPAGLLIEAQRVILGSVLLYPERLDQVAELPREAFVDEGFREVFGAITALAADGKAISIFTVSQRLGPKFTSPIAYLSKMTGDVIPQVNLSGYRDFLLERHQARIQERKRQELMALLSKKEPWEVIEPTIAKILDEDHGATATGSKSTPPSREGLEISVEELTAARLTATCIVKDYLFADVASVSAPGGTGKTTIVLYEAVCIALKRPPHGLEVRKQGWTLMITAEDQRERLVARLREIMAAMWLSDEEQQIVLKSVLIWDITGEQRRLIEVKDGNIVLTALSDEIVRRYRKDPPVLVIFDPLVSFGVSEAQVNDNEQAIVTACRRIVKRLDCCVRLIAHTGKANARLQTLDQYSSRGGSALSDGCRMVAVMATWQPDSDIKPPPGLTLQDGDSLTILARPKCSYAPPDLPLLWIKRNGYSFETFTNYRISDQERDEALFEQVELFLGEEDKKGHRHNKASLELGIPGLKRADVRKAIACLMAQGRIIEADLPPGEAKTKRKTYLTISAGFGEIQKNTSTIPALETSGNPAAAYRENNGGGIKPPIFPPFSNPAAISRRDSAGLAGLDEEQHITPVKEHQP